MATINSVAALALYMLLSGCRSFSMDEIRSIAAEVLPPSWLSDVIASGLPTPFDEIGCHFDPDCPGDQLESSRMYAVRPYPDCR